MSWIVLAAGTAVFLSLRDCLVKNLANNIHPLLCCWGLYLYATPILLVSVLVTSPGLSISEIPSGYSTTLLLASLCEFVAAIFYVRSMQLGELSRTIPLLSFIPAFQLLTGPLILEESVSQLGLWGVVFVIAGSYLFAASRSTSTLLDPFIAILKDKASRYMLYVALLWAISSMIGKQGSQMTSGSFWTLSLVLLMAVLFAFLTTQVLGWNTACLIFKKELRTKLFFPAACNALTILLFYLATLEAQVAYVSAIRRLGILLTAVYGILYLKESYSKTSASGLVLLVFGAIWISLFAK